MFAEFLQELEEKSINLSFSNGKLIYEGPEENLTPELIDRLKLHKARLIRYLWPPECHNILPVNPLGTKIPFVLVYFEVMNYCLSDYFGKDQPFYGFLHYGSRGEKVKYRSVETFAAEYIIQLQKVIPKGPYFLGGFSFGGLLAFEMAIQLQKAGHEVPFLALLDSYTGLVKEEMCWQGNIFKTVKRNILGPTRRKISRIIRLNICNFFLFIKKPVPVFLRNFYIVNRYTRLTKSYKPQKFKGEVLLFRSEMANPDFKFNGWESFVDKVNLVTFKGKHMAIARDKEYAEVLGREFLRHLSAVYKT